MMERRGREEVYLAPGLTCGASTAVVGCCQLSKESSVSRCSCCVAFAFASTGAKTGRVPSLPAELVFLACLRAGDFFVPTLNASVRSVFPSSALLHYLRRSDNEHIAWGILELAERMPLYCITRHEHKL